jgi:hypothetical protein
MRTGIFSAGVAAALAVSLTACVTFRGVSEFDSYRRAYESAHSVGSRILDQLAAAERHAYAVGYPETYAQTGVIRPFVPDDAAYYATGVDPPGTAAFRRALDMVNAYNDLLYGLASGETANMLSAKLTEFGAQVFATAVEVRTAAGAQGSGALTNLIGALGLAETGGPFQNVAGLAFRFATREAFRGYVDDYYLPVRRTLEALRNDTPTIFFALNFGTIQQYNLGELADDVAVARITNNRALLSDWVLLLDASTSALDRAYAALSGSPSLIDAVGGMTAAAIEIELVARSAREHMAAAAVN